MWHVAWPRFSAMGHMWDKHRCHVAYVISSLGLSAMWHMWFEYKYHMA
jgi:hypothetical protein